MYLKGCLDSQQTNIKWHLNFGNNINSNHFLEVLIAGVKLAPMVKDVSKCEGNRRVKTFHCYYGTGKPVEAFLMQTQNGLMSESLNSLQKVKVRISKEDLVGGVVYGESTGPLQLGGYDGTGVASIHADSADIRRVTPVGPVKPSGKKMS